VFGLFVFGLLLNQHPLIVHLYARPSAGRF